MPQHVVQRGNNRATCFRSDEDRRHYLRWLADAAGRCGCHVHAYVLMTNHVHLLVTGDSETSIPGLMQSLGTRFARYINRRYERTGTLWEGRYHASLVDSESYLLGCMRYIEANPVRAAIVASPAAYRWSSFRCNAMGETDERITPHPAYEKLGDRPEARCAAYALLFDQALPAEDLACIRDSTRGGLPTGSDAFREWVAARLGSVAVPLKRGRPVTPRGEGINRL
jgi:putative transposase